MQDLIKELIIAENLASGNSPNAANLYRRAREEIERCHARLEIDHYFILKGREMVRKEIPWNERETWPDGISARDETIALLDERRTN